MTGFPIDAFCPDAIYDAKRHDPETCPHCIWLRADDDSECGCSYCVRIREYDDDEWDEMFTED